MRAESRAMRFWARCWRTSPRPRRAKWPCFVLLLMEESPAFNLAVNGLEEPPALPMVSILAATYYKHGVERLRGRVLHGKARVGADKPESKKQLRVNNKYPRANPSELRASPPYVRGIPPHLRPSPLYLGSWTRAGLLRRRMGTITVKPSDGGSGRWRPRLRW